MKAATGSGGRGRGKWLAAALAAAALAAFIGTRVVPTEKHPPPRVVERAVGAVDPFDGRGRLPAGPYRAAFSPNGAHLAVLDSRGVSLAEHGALRRIDPPDGGVVDFAFLPGSGHLLLGQGPEVVRRLLVFAIDGTATGHVPLDPPLSLGNGNGMAVDGTGRTAVVTEVVRSPLGEEHRHLVAVDLREGTTRSLTPADGPDESRPVFADDETIAFTSTTEAGSSVAVLHRQTGAVEPVSPAGRSSALAAARDGRVLYVTEPRVATGRTTSSGAVPEERTVWLAQVDGGAPVRVAALGPGEALATADLANDLLIVAERGEATTLRARQLPARSLRPPAAPPSSGRP